MSEHSGQESQEKSTGAKNAKLTPEQIRAELLTLSGDGTWVRKAGTRYEALTPSRDINGYHVAETLITNGRHEIRGLMYDGGNGRFHPEVPEGWQWWNDHALQLRRNSDKSWDVG